VSGVGVGVDLAQHRRQILASLPDRFDLPDVAPRPLARRFAMMLAAGPAGDELTEAVSERLLDLTVREAVAHTPFYAGYFSSLTRKTRRIGVADLAQFPVLERAQLESAGDRIVSRWATYGFSTYTSGTSTGSQAVVDRSIEEQRYATAFFTLLMNAAGGESSEPVLSMGSAHHGRSLQLPGYRLRIPVTVEHTVGLRTATKLLAREFRIGDERRRIRGVGGSLKNIERLTAFLIGEGLHELTEEVGLLQSTSEYLTDSARRRLKQFWGSEVEDRFGVSEILGGAARCGECGMFHFEPYAIPEVVDISTDDPLETGRGRLLLTGLYPFAQMTPLIRYATGDLVEVTRRSCRLGDAGYRLLGRESRRLELPEIGPGRFLGHAEVIDALDGIPGLAKEPLHRHLPADLGPALGDAGSPPAVRFLRNPTRIVVGTCFEISAQPARMAELERRVTTALRTRFASLAALFDEGQVTVTLMVLADQLD
jgi:hypothetical protein